MQSSLNLDVFFKNKTGEIEKKKLRDILITLSADEIQRSHVSEMSPLTVNQRGPNCAMYALQGATDWLAANTTSYPRARKDKIYKTSWRQLAKEEKIITIGGTELNDLYPLVKKHVDKAKLERYQHGEKSEADEEAKKEYTTLLCNTLDHHSIILPFALPKISPFLAEEDQKKQAIPCTNPHNLQNGHAVLAWGYIFYENTYYALITHLGAHYLCSVNDIYVSNTLLIDTYPKPEVMYKIKDSWESRSVFLNMYRTNIILNVKPLLINPRASYPFQYTDKKSTNKFSMLAIPSPEFKTANGCIITCLLITSWYTST